MEHAPHESPGRPRTLPCATTRREAVALRPRAGTRGWARVALLGAVTSAACAHDAHPAPRATGGGPGAAVAPLAAWSDGAARRAIVRFVTAASDPASPTFVPAAARVAVFDNDGTLWCERPVPPQAAFVLDELRLRAERNPVLAGTPVYRAALARDAGFFTALPVRDLVAAALDADAGLSVEAYADRARAFLATARHPRYGVQYTALAYQPMLELLAYLRAQGFRVFIVTGGEAAFVRTFAPALYGVPAEAIAGTNVAYDLRSARDGVVLVRRAALDGPVDDGPGKPPALQRQIGQRPVIAVGNSDGDLAMLEYSGGATPALRILLHHDDATREYAYDRGADRALAAARAQGWLVVSMRDDFRRVFADTAPRADRLDR